jgi:methionine aminopeptidase
LHQLFSNAFIVLLLVAPACWVQVINEIADNYNYGVIREYVGHGVGRHFHSAPTIQHFRNNHPGTMQPWQTFTIEPMLVQVSLHCWVTNSQAGSASQCAFAGF